MGGDSSGTEQGARQERTGGSEVPCDVPLRWRIARVDRDFGLGEDEAAAFVQYAADLWQGAATRRLFVRDSIDGFPIRFVYDSGSTCPGGLPDSDVDLLRARCPEVGRK
jgi:hypothetical protein